MPAENLHLRKDYETRHKIDDIGDMIVSINNTINGKNGNIGLKTQVALHNERIGKDEIHASVRGHSASAGVCRLDDLRCEVFDRLRRIQR